SREGGEEAFSPSIIISNAAGIAVNTATASSPAWSSASHSSTGTSLRRPPVSSKFNLRFDPGLKGNRCYPSHQKDARRSPEMHPNQSSRFQTRDGSV
ncbi:hypothetical protein FRC20_005308, partial [Serendipita sp. 405]